MDYRVILFHKQATSARTRFVRFEHDSVCAFKRIPKLAQLAEELPGKTVLHPAAILTQLEQEMGFEPGTLEAEGEYQQLVEVPDETIQIILANVNTMDPPFDEVKKAGGSFIDLTEARGLPPIELELLRTVYEYVLGG